MLMAGQKMMNKYKKYMEIGRELLCSLLFPKRCPVCDKILEPEEIKKGIHYTCENKFYTIQKTVCMHCGRPIGNRTLEYCYDCIQKRYDKNSYITQAKALYLYKGAIKMTMYRFKYSNKREYASFFAKQVMGQYAEWMNRIDADVIVPVPMYRKKQKKRGYNQAESFAKEISKLTGVPIKTDLVSRVIDTAPQKGLDALQRKNNLKKAFHSKKNVVQYKRIIVVDDIYTTGSTAEAVAKELIKKGARQVYLITVCIGEEM